MKTIQQLLADKPVALAHIEQLISLHDVWIVGGCARALVYDLPFPSDIDVLLNTERSSGGPLEASPADEYGQDKQKQTIGDVQFDVFHNGLVKWLAGGPCAGDGLAVRAKDNFVLQTGEFGDRLWTGPNARYTGRNTEYLEKHSKSLGRDLDFFTHRYLQSFASKECLLSSVT